MQKFSWNMQRTILKVNMLYFVSAIAKIWHNQKANEMGFWISFKKKVFFFFQSKSASNFYLSLTFMPENLIR